MAPGSNNDCGTRSSTFLGLRVGEAREITEVEPETAEQNFSLIKNSVHDGHVVSVVAARMGCANGGSHVRRCLDCRCLAANATQLGFTLPVAGQTRKFVRRTNVWKKLLSSTL